MLGQTKAAGGGNREPPEPGAYPARFIPLSLKLIGALLAALLLTFGLLGFVNVRLHRRHLERATLAAAERISDTIKRSASYHMLRNDRDAVYQSIRTIGAEPGIEKIRIFDSGGHIGYSTDPAEINRQVDMRAEACYACHSQAEPLRMLNRPDRFRIYKVDHERVLGVINPIENQPACSNADCHAHPASQKILGVLDTNLSLRQTDADLRESTLQMIAYTVVFMIGFAVLSWLLVWRVVHKPVKALTRGTERLMKGELGYQIPLTSDDEVGELANSFNQMSLRLREANEEVTAWARTLEERVEEKVVELNQANEQMLHVEKMASIGKLAAVVAHEVNNPLSGILTYARLLTKRIDRGELVENCDPQKRGDTRQCLELIASESRRCGDLVRDLLTFSRSRPMNLAWADLNPIAERCVRIVQHQLEMNNIQWQVELEPELPLVHCDAAQIEQVLLALIMNAIDAMPRGGNLYMRTRALLASRSVELQVRDDGSGIAPDLLPKLFEPFNTTKEAGRGVGLGLAISKGIIERHLGEIAVDSQAGRGTCFHIFLPLDAAHAGRSPKHEAAVGT
ncbi:MAG: ATP-binding protein [Terriglobales bacterium]